MATSIFQKHATLHAQEKAAESDDSETGLGLTRAEVIARGA